MAEAIPETITAASKAAEVAAKPNVLVTIFAIAALAGCGFLVWRDEVRADAQIGVLQAMEKRMAGQEGETRELRRAFTNAGIKLRTAAAVARDPE